MLLVPFVAVVSVQNFLQQNMVSNIVFCFLAILPFVLCSDILTETTRKEFLDKLENTASYDKRIQPPTNNASDPLIILVNTYILSVNQVDDHKQTFQVEVYFRQFWKDERLKYEDKNGRVKSMSFSDESLIWIPDTFFSNEHKSHFHDLTTDNKFIRINSDGSVAYSMRITLTLRCPMDLSEFPFDTQTCDWQIESYGHRADNIIYKWKGEEPIQLPDDLHIYVYELESVEPSDELVSTTSGTFSTLKVTFTFVRNLDYYLIHIFIPCTMMVLLSWTEFWIHRSKLTPRIIIGISTLYALVHITSELNDELPKVSYTKSMDIYTGVSLAFVFATLLQSMTVHFYTVNRIPDADPEAPKTAKESSTILSKLHKNNFMKKWIFCEKDTHRLDIISRICFPILFLVFNIIYWIVNLSA